MIASLCYDPDEYYDEKEFIVTSTGNIISTSATINNPKAVEIPAGRCIVKGGVVIRGDVCNVKLNKYTMVCENTQLTPCKVLNNESKQSSSFSPLTIGSHSYIGKNCIIESLFVGQGCCIEDNVTLKSRSVLKDYVYVKEGSVVPEDMTLPPFAIVEGDPATIVAMNFESYSTLALSIAVSRYKNFKKT